MSNEKKKKLRVIVCRPGERAAVEEIGEDLASILNVKQNFPGRVSKVFFLQ